MITDPNYPTSDQSSIVNALASDRIVFQQLFDAIGSTTIIHQFNPNWDGQGLTNSILNRKLKAFVGVLVMHGSWDTLARCIKKHLLNYVTTYIDGRVDSSKSRNASAKENESNFHIHKRFIQNPITHHFDTEGGKHSQELKDPLVTTTTTDTADESLPSSFEAARKMQLLQNEMMQKSQEREYQSPKRDNLSSPGNVSFNNPRSAVTPKEQRVFSAISGSTCTLLQFKQYVAHLPDINARNSGKVGDTPLMLLLRKTHLRSDDEIPKIEVLLRLGASWTATNNQGASANIIARKHDSAVIDRLRKIQPVDIDERVPLSEPLENYSVSPEMQKVFSAVSGDTYSLPQFEEAVNNVPNINCRNSGKKGDTALMMLLRKDVLKLETDIPKIKILLSYDASWTATNNRGETAMQLATKHPSNVLDMIKFPANSANSTSSNPEQVSTPVSEREPGQSRGVSSQKSETPNYSTNASINYSPPLRHVGLRERKVIDAIKNRNSSIGELRRVISRVENLNFCDNSEVGDPPLMLLLRQKDLNLSTDVSKFELLRNFGASLDYRNNRNQSARDLISSLDKNFFLKIQKFC
ncbi:uncharacterized protein TRIADDRAFT_57515 [Trichoplax adhaerens]|uniref:Uncharacterized protein n=1 Tax=Trichoplax adhaerens TaxID=10228 RepID=B3RZN2_TRIAD|nr:predicted protein [Trichoplax adhaerens]EDV23870.1 predicted protein [Trichoplax adhaerens]|eukprot:XP_002113396.1 predicted protein [Trichoplax adhaerens]